MRFFKHIAALIRFMQVPKEKRHIVFYSENGNYWTHFKGIIHLLLQAGDVGVCYITSSANDEGLKLNHPNYSSFVIDDGAMRNWLFENMDAPVFAMTMPDLNQFQVKRSKLKTTKHVYIQHSLVSLHMAYRAGAFDYFDVVCCAGPHHVQELRAIEQQANRPAKTVLEHGYGRLDQLVHEAERRNIKPFDATKTHLDVLIAPSWGPQGAIESGMVQPIIAALLAQGHKVTLRPHPQTIKLAPASFETCLKRFGTNLNFAHESNVSSAESLYKADVMFSDWSGAALEFALAFKKPVVFMDVPIKVNNQDYKAIPLEPFEVSMRNQLGVVWKDGMVLVNILRGLPAIEPEKYVYNLGFSDQIAADYLRELVRTA